jgi:hypothetical protein
MRIPLHYRSKAKENGLRTWIDGSNFDRDSYFKSIDDLVLIIGRHVNEDDAGESEWPPDWTLIAPIVSGLIYRERKIYEHLEKKKKLVDSAEEWTELCTAAAWVVLERYERAVNGGSWKGGE